MYLHEEVLLLALKDDSGKVDWKASFLEYIMAGALLAELLLEERIEVSSDSKKLVTLTNSSHHENTVIDEALDMIRKSRKDRGIQHWVTKLLSLKKLKEKTAKQLCRLGVLKEEESKILFIYTSKKYPELNPEPEQQLISRLREAITSENDVDIRTAALISLTYDTGILAIPFSKKELKASKKRLKDISSGEVIGEATEAAINAIQATIAVIVIMPAITSAASPPGGGC